MKFSRIINSTALLVLTASVQAKLECALEQTKMYQSALDYSSILQDMIDEASRLQKPVVHLDSGLFAIDPENPIVLKKGVSLQGSLNEPTIFTAKDKYSTASIKVYRDNKAWAIENIVFENVNIVVEENKNQDETAILSNLFFNGGRGSVIAQHGERLYIDGNIFLRDQLHQGEMGIPTYNNTNTGVLFQAQKNSVVSNNIFGMDLRKMDVLEPVVDARLKKPLQDLRFIHDCLGRELADEQGYLASGLQLYFSRDITIKENILNATFPDTHPVSQNHGISVVGSNQTYIHQNFIAGWKIADFGGAIRFTSAVDGYVMANYFANTGVMMYAAVHADFKQVSNMVLHNNFLYRFLHPELTPAEESVFGWLYEGFTYFDFYTARLNYTTLPPIWNSSVPISPWGWHIAISDNKFGASEGLDPNFISLGNLDPDEIFVDGKNCYVTEPLVPGLENDRRIPVLWRQNFAKDVYTKHEGKIPQNIIKYTTDDLASEIPAHLRNMKIPDYWKAFTLKNDTIPMLSPDTECYRPNSQ